MGKRNGPDPPRLGAVCTLLHELQIQRDPDTVDEDDALVEELLVGDFRVDELLESVTRADEFDGFGGFFCGGRELVQHGKIEELKLDVRRNSFGDVFEQRREKKVEALRGPLVDGTFGGAKLQ